MTQPPGQTLAYVRVSATGQNLARQLAALGPFDQLFEEKRSGGQRADRVKLAELICCAREGDVIRVVSMDRLARSATDLDQIMSVLVGKGATVEFIDERLSFRPGHNDPYATFQLGIMGAFGVLERAIAKERQADGIRQAKERGVYKGRARKLTAEQLATARERSAQGIPKARVARELGIDRSTLYRALARPAKEES